MDNQALSSANDEDVSPIFFPFKISSLRTLKPERKKYSSFNLFFSNVRAKKFIDEEFQGFT